MEDRFPFGENWREFLSVLDDERIREAELSLADWLGTDSLAGKRFLDIGCGSGLFSLAAYRLGAEAVHSLDFDPSSVGCAMELRRRYGDEQRWTIERGDALDVEYLAGLGTWDIVYSWGVLHHTGDMWSALGNVAPLVTDDGTLFISIYNDQGLRSRVWRRIKRRYNALPPKYRTAYAVAVMGPRELLSFAAYTAAGRPHRYVQTWTQYKKSRGMSRWHDNIDWVGGYPFEVAKPEQIFDFFTPRGFRLQRLFTCAGGWGCNQFVFTRESGTARSGDASA
jgi:2-polyprenyl-6-hydroxyphenyl methylase/3-demethylubiquinone-9 3-methyltransferase